ncbi:MAG: oxaloacetate decarboxylase [Clostridiaceae bacterium]|jgi:Na+-transporting methylmalonyl-CoA/oxaloacetate decarboxylase gamma subunit|nr:oxaloacetate decarboxylase [Clostridiaceae bacterium]
MNWKTISDGLTISAIGLAGVFTVLIIFYLSTKIMMTVARKFSKPDNAD